VIDRLDAVVFDFDGVINRNYDEGGYHWSRDIQRDFGICPNSFSQRLFGEAFKAVIVGEVDLADAVGPVLTALGCTAPPADFLAYWFDRDIALCASTLALMGRLRAAGVRCVIGTNNERRRAAYIWENAGMSAHADAIYASGLMGKAKPDAAFFAHIADDLCATDPARLLLIDDMPSNVAGARAAGWQAVLYGDHSARRLGVPADLVVALGA
jgi:putative hydrolase of the HAD superfamily